MLRAPLFVMAKDGKQKSPTTDEWINKMQTGILF